MIDLQNNWMFLLASRPMPEFPAILDAILTSRIKTVVLEMGCWFPGAGVVTREYADRLVNGFQDFDIEVGFHVALQNASELDAKLPAILKQLWDYRPGIVYADGMDGDKQGTIRYHAELRKVIGPYGAMGAPWVMNGQGVPNDCQMYDTRDQMTMTNGNIYGMTDSLGYALWRAREEDAITDPSIPRRHIGWIGEDATVWPLEIYERVWRVARKSKHPLFYRTPVSLLVNEPKHVELIGYLEGIDRIMRSVA